jgi:H+-translocating NAD(P) transhydrogenase subunit alpha
MRVAIVRETEAGEQRVAMVPDVAARLIKLGIEVWVESGAGDLAFCRDSDYEAVGAHISGTRSELLASADVVVKVAAPCADASDLEGLRSGAVLLSFLNPLGQPELIGSLADRGVTAFSMEMIPRTSRAQSMDALSSQANIGGYKAVLLAADYLPKYFPMLTTAAGTIAPAKVLVMGAGVAGLQAIATARRLGAVVEGFDIRPEVKEQVQSLGAKFIDVTLTEETRAEGGYAKELSAESQERTREILTQHVHASDVVITTAQVPGRRAPLLVTDAMLNGMKPGSVVIDMAADQGGNCEGSAPGEMVVRHGVRIYGPVNLPASVPVHASQLYSKNILSLLMLMVKDGELVLNFEDDIIAGACMCHGGEVRNDRVKGLLDAAKVPQSA